MNLSQKLIVSALAAPFPCMLASVPVTAETISIECPSVSGSYAFQTIRQAPINIGFQLYDVQSVSIAWEGEITTGAWSCDFLPTIGAGGEMWASFVEEQFAYAFHSESSEIIAWPIPFNTTDPFGLHFGATFEFLRDGVADLEVTFLPFLGIPECGYVPPFPTAELHAASLNIVATRMHDYDDDGRVDSIDFESFDNCFSGASIPYEDMSCAVFDSDHDNDVDCHDWSTFLRAWTGPPVDLPELAACACSSDFNGDGVVGPADLAALLGAWGPNPGHPLDLNGDGEVGPPDLAQLLGAWGPCNSALCSEVGAPCDDGDPCTSYDGALLGTDACDGMGNCLGIPVDCDDGEICTTPDMCDPETGMCLNPFVPQCPGIDIVFVFDTSQTLMDEANTICSNISTILNAVQSMLDNPAFPEDIPVTVTIYGITEDVPCGSGNVRDVFGPEVPGGGACPDLDGCGTEASNRESWGPATAIIASEFPWQAPTDAIRLIIPVSDEGPCCGGDEQIYACGLSDAGSIDNACAIANSNGVVVSPFIGTLAEGAPMCILEFAQELADCTGGSSYTTVDLAELPDDLVDLIVENCPCF